MENQEKSNLFGHAVLVVIKWCILNHKAFSMNRFSNRLSFEGGYLSRCWQDSGVVILENTVTWKQERYINIDGVLSWLDENT